MKTILLLLTLAMSAISAPKERDITPLITGVVWKWDHPAAKGRTLRFRPDGTMESNEWKGRWKVTGPAQVTMTITHNRTSVLTFNEQFTAYTGTHFDGNAVVGKRAGDVAAGLR